MATEKASESQQKFDLFFFVFYFFVCLSVCLLTIVFVVQYFPKAFLNPLLMVYIYEQTSQSSFNCVTSKYYYIY